MRRLLLALAFAFALPAALSASGCASFQAYQPSTAREALAEAEIAFVGVVQVATDGVRAGAISRDEAVKLDAQFVQVAHYLDTAREFVRVGDESSANRTLALAHAIIRTLATELVNRAATGAASPPPPAANPGTQS